MLDKCNCSTQHNHGRTVFLVSFPILCLQVVPVYKYLYSSCLYIRLRSSSPTPPPEDWDKYWLFWQYGMQAVAVRDAWLLRNKNVNRDCPDYFYNYCCSGPPPPANPMGHARSGIAWLLVVNRGLTTAMTGAAGEAQDKVPTKTI